MFKKILKVFIVYLVLLLNTINNNTMATEKTIREREFYVISSSNYERNYRKGNFFYVGKIIINSNGYGIGYISFSFDDDIIINYLTKDDDIRYRYNNKYLEPKILNLKTYKEILNFEKDHLPSLLSNNLNPINDVLAIKNVFFVTEAGHYDVFTDYNDKRYSYNPFSEKKPEISKKEGLFNSDFILFLQQHSYFVVKPDFAKQLEKEKKFYVGTWDDVKEHVINPKDEGIDKFINVFNFTPTQLRL